MNRIVEILQSAKTIAVVGCSRDETKPAHIVPKYLQEQGFKIIPINPFAEEILGEKCYKNLSEIPEEIQKEIDIVDVFMPSADVPQIVEQIIQIRKKFGKPTVVWMQEGISNEGAKVKAEESGLVVVMNKCMMKMHERLE